MSGYTVYVATATGSNVNGTASLVIASNNSGGRIIRVVDDTGKVWFDGGSASVRLAGWLTLSCLGKFQFVTGTVGKGLASVTGRFKGTN